MLTSERGGKLRLWLKSVGRSIIITFLCSSRGYLNAAEFAMRCYENKQEDTETDV